MNVIGAVSAPFALVAPVASAVPVYQLPHVGGTPGVEDEELGRLRGSSRTAGRRRRRWQRRPWCPGPDPALASPAAAPSAAAPPARPPIGQAPARRASWHRQRHQHQNHNPEIVPRLKMSPRCGKGGACPPDPRAARRPQWQVQHDCRVMSAPLRQRDRQSPLRHRPPRAPMTGRQGQSRRWHGSARQRLLASAARARRHTAGRARARSRGSDATQAAYSAAWRAPSRNLRVALMRVCLVALREHLRYNHPGRRDSRRARRSSVPDQEPALSLPKGADHADRYRQRHQRRRGRLLVHLRRRPRAPLGMQPRGPHVRRGREAPGRAWRRTLPAAPAGAVGAAAAQPVPAAPSSCCCYSPRCSRSSWATTPTRSSSCSSCW